jgi:hypothetical protein
MDRRYRIFLYFLAILIVGSLLLDWLSGSVRIPAPAPVHDTGSLELPPASPGAATPQPTLDGAGYVPPYAPSYENPSIADDETSKVRDVPPAEQQSPKPMANSSDLQPPAPPPTAAPDAEETPDRDQYTTAPKSSNAALRETLKKGR